jgi:hypothetical protein
VGKYLQKRTTLSLIKRFGGLVHVTKEVTHVVNLQRRLDMTLTIGKIVPRVGKSKIRSARPGDPIFSRGFVIGEQKQTPSQPSTKEKEKEKASRSKP